MLKRFSLSFFSFRNDDKICLSGETEGKETDNNSMNDSDTKHSRKETNVVYTVDTHEKFRFIKQCTTNISHYKQSFYQHLYHVGLFLYKSKERVALCDAGLYHSIYGTEFFHMPSSHQSFKEVITREKIQSLIGVEAENLAYIFCSLKKDRFLFILENRLNLHVDTHLDLCKLEFSNLLDQNDKNQYDNKLLALGNKIRELSALSECKTHIECYNLRSYQARLD